MQDAIFYVAAGETLGVVRDYANAKNVSPPTFVRGVEVRLRMRLFAGREEPVPYPVEKLEGIARWQWAMDSDFDEGTNAKLVGDSPNIEVSSITEDIDGTEYEFTEITIPMPEMNTVELVNWMGVEKSKSGLHGELVGFDETGRQSFILQIENFTVRNRITSAGNPTGIDPEYMTIPQIEALFCARMDVQLSVDGEEWVDASPQAGVDSPQQYRWHRFRNAAVGDKWSDPVPLLIGPRGYAGTLRVGTVTQEDVARVENIGDEHDAVLDFGLPKGDKGDAATIRIGTVTTAPTGSPGGVTNSGDEHDAVLDFVVPKGDKGEKGNTGNAATFTLGEVKTGAAGTEVAMTNTGTKYNAILNFTIPRGDKGEKGDKATVNVGTTTTGAPGTQASVANTGTEQNAVLSFTIPKGDRGECSYLHIAWAWDAAGTGFSLTPSADRKWRTELLLPERRNDLTIADFAGCVWHKCLGDDGAVFGSVEATDGETSVQAVSRIVFENAAVRLGNAGEAIVSFPDAGISDEDAFNGLLMIRDALGASRSGGGSPGGDAGEIEERNEDYIEPQPTDNNQSTWP